jgi:hypothetical protein
LGLCAIRSIFSGPFFFFLPKPSGRLSFASAFENRVFWPSGVFLADMFFSSVPKINRLAYTSLSAKPALVNESILLIF